MRDKFEIALERVRYNFVAFKFVDFVAFEIGGSKTSASNQNYVPV